MAKKNSVKKDTSLKNASGYFGRVAEFLRRPNVRFVMGILCAALSVFLCSSFISFFASGGGDQTVIEAMANGDLSTEENADTMTEEIKNVKTGQVTYAVRDTSIDGMEIKQGNIMGLDDSTIRAVGDSVEDTAYELLVNI